VPTIKLTQTSLACLSPASHDVGYCDATLPGFGVKITPKGRKVFVVLYRTGGAGSKLRNKIGPYGKLTLHQARIAAQKVFAAKLAGRDPAAEKRESKRKIVADGFSELLETFIAQRLSQNKSGGEIARLLRREFGQAWKGRSVHDLKKRDVVDVVFRSSNAARRLPQTGR
jgi:Arm DNA-binding domain